MRIVRSLQRSRDLNPRALNKSKTVNFMLTWLEKHYFWVYLWGCLLKRLTFELVDWASSIHPQDVEGLNRTKGGGRVDLLSQLELRHPLTSVLLVLGSWDSDRDLYHQPSDSLAFGLKLTPSSPLILKPLELGWITPLAFLVLQLANGRSWVSWHSQLHDLLNSYNKSPLIQYISYWLCYSIEPWIIQNL